jgi:hypothetical protein
MATFVQFVGKNDLLQAYKNRAIDTWAVCQGKEIISCGQGEEELEQFTDLLCRQSGDIVYTLRVYSAVSNPDTITNKTEYNGSFKFTLDGAPAGVGNVARAGASLSTADMITQKIMGRIGAVVEKELDKIFDGPEKTDPPESENGLWGVLKPYVDNPAALVQTIGAIKQLFGAVPAAAVVPMVVPSLAAVGAVSRAGAVEDEKDFVDNLSQPMLERLGAAIDRLGKCDTDIVVHLEQLATIAETKPDTYKMALNFLK